MQLFFDSRRWSSPVSQCCQHAKQHEQLTNRKPLNAEMTNTDGTWNIRTVNLAGLNRLLSRFLEVNRNKQAIQKTAHIWGHSWSWSYGSWIYNYLCNQFLSPQTLWVRILLMARCTRYNTSEKVCQWLATDQWFSLGTPVSFTNKTDRHNITDILLQVALNTINLTIAYIFVSTQTNIHRNNDMWAAQKHGHWMLVFTGKWREATCKIMLSESIHFTFYYYSTHFLSRGCWM